MRMEAYPYYGPGRPSTVFYDAVEEIYRPVAVELGFYREAIGVAPGPVLELGCGTGRISWPLAEAGYHVHGVDVAPAVLERAQRRGSQVQFTCADICGLDLGERYAAVIAPYRVFDHLVSEEAQQQFLAVARKHLQPGGVFVFDTNHPSDARLHSPEASINQKPLRVELPHLGAAVERSIANTWVEGDVLTTDFRYIVEQPGGVQSYIDRLSVRWQKPSQVRAMLVDADFELMAEYADFAKALPAADAEDRVWVAR